MSATAPLQVVVAKKILTTVVSSVGNPMPRAMQDKFDRVANEGTKVFRKAEEAFRLGQLLVAENECQEVNRIWGSKGGSMAPEVAHLMGRIRMRQGRYLDAIRIMAPNIEAIDLQQVDLALCYVKTGQREKALGLYQPELITNYNSSFGDSRPFLPDIHPVGALEGALLWTKGVALSNVGRPDEATDCYLQALKKIPNNRLLATRLAAAAENAQRYQEAADAYQVVLRTSPPSDGPEIRRSRDANLGRVKEVKEKQAEAKSR